MPDYLVYFVLLVLPSCKKMKEAAIYLFWAGGDWFVAFWCEDSGLRWLDIGTWTFSAWGGEDEEVEGGGGDVGVEEAVDETEGGEEVVEDGKDEREPWREKHVTEDFSVKDVQQRLGLVTHTIVHVC